MIEWSARARERERESLSGIATAALLQGLTTRRRDDPPPCREHLETEIVRERERQLETVREREREREREIELEREREKRVPAVGVRPVCGRFHRSNSFLTYNGKTHTPSKTVQDIVRQSETEQDRVRKCTRARARASA